MTRLRSESYNLTFDDHSYFELQGEGVLFHNTNQLRLRKNHGYIYISVVKPLDLEGILTLGTLDLGISSEKLLSDGLYEGFRVSVGSQDQDEVVSLDHVSTPFDILFFDKEWKPAANDSQNSSLQDFNFNVHKIKDLKRYVYLKIVFDTDLLSEDLIIDQFTLNYCVDNSLDLYFSDTLDSEGRGLSSEGRNNPKELTAGSLGGYQLLKSLFIPEGKDYTKFKLYWRIIGKQDDFVEIDVNKSFGGKSPQNEEEWLKAVQDTYFEESFFQNSSESHFVQVLLDNGDGSTSSADCIFLTKSKKCVQIGLSEDLKDSYYKDVNLMVKPFEEVSSLTLEEGFGITSAKVVKASNLEVIHTFTNLHSSSDLTNQIKNFQVDTGVIFVGNPMNIYSDDSLIENLVLVVDDSGSNEVVPSTANKIVKGIRIKPCVVTLRVTDNESSQVIPHFKFSVSGVNRGVGVGLVSQNTTTFSYSSPQLYDYLDGDTFNVAPLEYYDIMIVAEGYHPKTERFYIVDPVNELEMSLEDVDLDLQQKMQTVFDQMTDDTYGMNALKTTVETSISQNAILLGSIQSPDFGLNSLKSVLGSLNESSLGKLDDLLSLINTLDSSEQLINVLNILQDSTVGNEALASKLEDVKNKLESSSGSNVYRVSNIKSS